MKKIVSVQCCIVYCLILLFVPNQSIACTSFVVQGSNHLLLTKNLDWEINNGIILINKRGVPKAAYGDQPQKISWISKFGSVTFNQFGKEFPLGGMNEKGLVIEELNSWGETPKSDNKYQLNEFQWTQFCLDNFASVEELIESVDSICIVPMFLNLHYLICDSYGDVAIVEFYNGKRYLYNGDTLPYPILTNNHYENSIKYLDNFIGFGGHLEIKDDNTSNERFVKVAHNLKTLEPKNVTEVRAFEILDEVSQTDTQWTIVYNITNKSIQYKTRINQTIKSIDLANFDFSCKTSTLFLEVMHGVSFKELKTSDNVELLMDVFDKYESINPGTLSKKEFINLADYGNSIRCH